MTHCESSLKTSEPEHENRSTLSDQGSASSNTYLKNLLQNEEYYQCHTYSRKITSGLSSQCIKTRKRF